MDNLEIIKQEADKQLLRDGRINISQLSKDLGFTYDQINYKLTKLGYRKRDIFIQLPKRYITSFEKMTPELSYWLGYLQADGCINSCTKNGNSRKRLILECQEKDKEILYNFCNFTNINPIRIKYTTHINKSGSISKAVRLDLYSSCFTVFPDKWISERKSFLDVSIPDDVFFYDYLLGLLDGDGGIYGYGKINYQVHFMCREPMLSQIKEKLELDLPYPSSIWIKKHPTTKGLYSLIIGKGRNPNLSNFEFLYNTFYLNKEYKSLKRKRQKLINIINS